MSDNEPDSVIAKVHLLLNTFTQEKPTMGLTELSRTAGVSKASTHRLCQELVEFGYLGRSGTDYQLGWRIFDLGQRVPGPALLRAVARPALQDLRAVARAVVHLGIVQDNECVYLERLAGRTERRLLEYVADRLPLHMTATGRVLLAHMSPAELQDYAVSSHQAVHDDTNQLLHNRLETIRQERYAEERSTLYKGFRAIAVPVTSPDDNDHVVASISLTVPVDRRDTQQLLHSLWAASMDITRGLARRSTRW